MSYRARIYLAAVMLGGLALIVRALLDPVPHASLWFTCAILSVLAVRRGLRQHARLLHDFDESEVADAIDRIYEG